MYQIIYCKLPFCLHDSYTRYWNGVFNIREKQVFKSLISHVLDVFAAFYIGDRIFIANIVKIKLSQIKDSTLYFN